MTYFSSMMAKIIEEDLKNNKIDDLDFEKDPHQIVSDLIFALSDFDKIANRQCLNSIKPKLE
jgi:hypothetical protein